jgi:ABC-type transport system involved in multi-copper enzyme maturation permease subunit
MMSSFFFELIKLRKRPSTWVLGFVLVLVVLFFDYYQFYSAITSLEEGGSDPTQQITDVEEFKEYLLPASVTVNVAGLLATFGGPIALILGALSVGGEYGWGTLKTILTQRPGRVSVLCGKLLAVGTVVLVYSALALAAGAVGSYVVAGVFERSVDWPSVGNIVKGLGVIWLVLGAWASIGAFLAVLFRGTALAIGLGLVYGLAIEGLIFGFSDQSKIMEAITYVLLGRNGGDLANSLGKAPRAFTAPDPTDPVQAALVLGGYVLALLLLAAFLLRRRDVT